MPKADGSPTAGEVTAEQLRATKAELSRFAQQLSIREEALAEKSAAASLAEQLRIAREDKRAERKGEKLPAHRPSGYTEEEATALCQWIAEGKSLRSWCQQAGRSTSMFTVYGWLRDRPDFSRRYAQAHDDRSDSLADEIIEIADAVADSDSIAAVQAAKLRVETRKWVSAKLKPGKWGDKQTVEQTGTVTFQLGIPARSTAVPLQSATAVPIEHGADGKPLISQEVSPDPADSQSDSREPGPV
jgi:hypothetical protein